MDKVYYVAYGSNLNMRQMQSRCPNAKAVRSDVLEDYELEFRGGRWGAHLTIRPKAGSKVPVGIWEVTESDIDRLDLYEGSPGYYHKAQVRVGELTAFTYIMNDGFAPGAPLNEYMQSCIEGYRDFGFDESVLFEAAHKSVAVGSEEE